MFGCPATPLDVLGRHLSRVSARWGTILRQRARPVLTCPYRRMIMRSRAVPRHSLGSGMAAGAEVLGQGVVAACASLASGGGWVPEGARTQGVPCSNAIRDNIEIKFSVTGEQVAAFVQSPA
jgi:hypothetical protein